MSASAMESGGVPSRVGTRAGGTSRVPPVYCIRSGDWLGVSEEELDREAKDRRGLPCSVTRRRSLEPTRGSYRERFPRSSRTLSWPPSTCTGVVALLPQLLPD
jgi:hypothetical protein